MSVKSRGGGEYYFSPRNVISRNWAFFLCLASFCLGMFFTNRLWIVPEGRVIPGSSKILKTWQTNFILLIVAKLDLKLTRNLDYTRFSFHLLEDLTRKVYNFLSVFSYKYPFSYSHFLHLQVLDHSANNSIGILDKAISSLEMKLVATRAERESLLGKLNVSRRTDKRKYFMVIGINTAFSSRKRRDSVRETWMPQGEKLKKLEEAKGIIIRFVIGHSTLFGGILDKAIEAEEKMHGDFLRLEHTEGYMELSAKTKVFFSTAVSLWDAEFYVKVDDDIHVNLATLATILSTHRNKSRVYVGCMKSGPVLSQKGVKYHEPEYWKFGEVGNKYFRHATGQLYAISKDLATYILINQDLLHKYANEDVSLGSWFIGLKVEHVDDKRLCCGTPPDCELKMLTRYGCAAAFDWKCSGICRSVERMSSVHESCGERDDALWALKFLQR
ncbi:PREDICTED: probable beta-1,3-galactosyltransferase 1 [Tarenaya hassleriana]|uniref:probable beta-1,3-galactosyltransferase 1 n=1 Tax=Tarenaya hassleriana TaxID=28532 RepID=UPI00053C66CF|nr:PREDICTED: probable beta-1,3-galactosyltransferase 1 [Tarenaya hassleriana]